MKIFRTKRVIYRIETNENGTLDIFREYFSTKNMSLWEKDGRPFQNAGMLINQQGGIEALLAKCEDVDDIESMIDEINAEKKAIRERANEERIRQQRETSERAKAEFDKAFANEVTETNIENIGILLRYLNTQNCGLWRLPAMSIGYQCNQYDCDGRTATTIKLDTPILYDDKMVSMFVYGNPRGHLVKYTQIR